MSLLSHRLILVKIPDLVIIRVKGMLGGTKLEPGEQKQASKYSGYILTKAGGCGGKWCRCAGMKCSRNVGVVRMHAS